MTYDNNSCDKDACAHAVASPTTLLDQQPLEDASVHEKHPSFGDDKMWEESAA